MTKPSLNLFPEGDLSDPQMLEQLFQQLVSQLPPDEASAPPPPPEPLVQQAEENPKPPPAVQRSSLPQESHLQASHLPDPNAALPPPPPLTPATPPMQQGLMGEELSNEAQLRALFEQSQPQIPQPPAENLSGLQTASPPGIPNDLPSEAQLLALFLQSHKQVPLPPFPESETQLPQSTTEPPVAVPLSYGKTPQFYFLRSPASSSLPAQQRHFGFDVEAIRQDFPILHQEVNGKPLIWLDNAATSQKPQIVMDTLTHFYQRDNSNVHRGAHTLAARATNAYEEAREKIQRFLGASLAKEIIYVRGTTEGINLVAQTYGRQQVKAGDEILVSTLEHHANIVPWQMLAQEKEAVLRVIPISDRGEILLEDYEKLLSEKTRIVALSQVSNVLGTVLPIKTMTAMAHRYGAVVLVDGAQSVPHLRVNVQDLDADFFVFSGHKILGPTGIGVLYGKAALLEAMPPWQGGGNMIEAVTFEKTTFNEIPNKFEAGTGNIADAVGLGVALDYLNQIGFEAAIQYEHQLMTYATQALSTIAGLRQIGTAPGKVSTLSFVLAGIRSEEVGKFLSREGIAVRAGHHCAQPTLQRYGLASAVRPSLAFYNTCDEIDTLIAAIEKAKKELV